MPLMAPRGGEAAVNRKGTPATEPETRNRVARMGRAVLDRTVAGRRMHGGLVPRNGAKKDAKPPPTKNPLAAWRTSRLRVRSGCRDLTPVGAGRDRNSKTNWATRPQVPRLPFQVLRFRASRFPFPGSRSPGPARGASLRSGSEIRSGIPFSRAPALPFSGPNGEGPTPKCEVRRAKGEDVLPKWEGLCWIGRWQAGECTAGWFHATAQRRTPSRRPQRISLRRGVLRGFA